VMDRMQSLSQDRECVATTHRLNAMCEKWGSQLL
jgi:hypothetical protein